MTLGISLVSGSTDLVSQLEIVQVETPKVGATSFCSSPKSSLLFQIWSPIVLNLSGYRLILAILARSLK